MSENELRSKAIEYLESCLDRPQDDDELNIYDVCEVYKTGRRMGHFRMEELVRQGKFTTRLAYVEKYGKKMRLWKPVE